MMKRPTNKNQEMMVQIKEARKENHERGKFKIRIGIGRVAKLIENSNRIGKCVLHVWTLLKRLTEYQETYYEKVSKEEG